MRVSGRGTELERNVRPALIAVACAGLFAAPLVEAQGVRCVDPSGRVYYGNQVPAGVTCVQQDGVLMPKPRDESTQERQDRLKRERETQKIYRQQDKDNSARAAELGRRQAAEAKKQSEANFAAASTECREHVQRNVDARFDAFTAGSESTAAGSVEARFAYRKCMAGKGQPLTSK